MRIFRVIIILGNLLAFGWMANAQLNMPTSVEGIGIPSPKIPNGFGGAPALSTSTTLFSGINFANPASYASFQYAGFDMGANVENATYTYQPTNLQNSYSQIDFTNVHVGFPIKSGKIGFVIGAYPFSKIGYKLGYASPLIGGSSTDTVLNISRGTGASQMLHLGLGIRVFKNWSVGLNLGYLWGSKRMINVKSFIYNNYMNTTTRLDMFWGTLASTLGVMGNIPLRSGGSIGVGATLSLPLTQTTATSDGYYGTIYAGGYIDTLIDFKQSPITVSLPSSYEVGVSYSSKTQHFTIGANVKQTNWSRLYNSQLPNFIYKYVDDWTLAAGLSIRPIKDMGLTTTKKSYFGYMTYQVGASYGMTRLVELSTGKRLSEYSVSAGLQLPLRKYNYSYQFGSIVLNFRYTSQGSPTENLFSYNSLTFQLGFILNDLWFMKRKFD